MFRGLISERAVLFQIFLCCLLLTPMPAKAENDLFLQPQFLSLYGKTPQNLSETEQWRLKIHGLRLAALDPRVWAIRKSDRTENRRLVVIRPFYLRESGEPAFIIKEFLLQFVFKKVGNAGAQRNYHDKESVLDVGFGGRYKAGAPLTRPLVDDSYVLRLAAFGNVTSGILYRSYDKHVMLKEFKPPILESGRNYELKMIFEDDLSSVYLDGEKIQEFKKPDINRGLFYLKTGWNPIHVTKLKVMGLKDGQPRVFGGLVNTGLKKFK